MDSDASSSTLDPIEKLAEEYLKRLRRGEHPTPAEYAARYPELAARILELFPALELLEGLKPAPDDQPGPRDHASAGVESAIVGPGAQRLGDYTLLRELGRGGMGIVYEAEHDSLKNRVALKVMHPRFRADRTYLRRFQTEARSAAKLHHTNIVPVFDFGEQDGICYYAMQSIAGVGLDRVLEDVRRLRAIGQADVAGRAGAGGNGDDQATDPVGGRLSAVSRGLLTGRFSTIPVTPAGSAPALTMSLDPGRPDQTADVVAPDRPPPAPASAESVKGSGSNSFAGQPESVYFREIARLGAQVADALDYAHRQNVVHRDIKPSNLLLDAYGNAWVTDFGLAKLVEGDDLSGSHDLAGTLRFMAPERLRGVTDRRSDIYALGATLYELLALRPALAEQDQVRLIDQIAHQPPLPLRQLDPRIPRDLETIVLKTLSKDPGDRCETAGELRDELRRFLEGRPTRWRRVGPVEQFRRWCRRNPGLAAASIVAVGLLVIVAIGSTLAAWRFHRDGLRIQAGESATRVSLFDSRMNLFESLVAQAQARRFSHRAGQRFESLDVLDRAVAIARELNLTPDHFDRLRDEAIACMALPDLRETGRVIRRPPAVLQVAFDPAMTRYALRFQDGTIKVRRVADDAEIDRFAARGDRDISVFRFSPDGRYLATTQIPGFALTVRDVDRRTVALDAPGPVAWPAARFSPNGRRIALCRFDGATFIYDLPSGRQAAAWSGAASGQDLDFSPDGARIATLHNEPARFTCRIGESGTGRLVGSIKLPSRGATVAWGPDGATLQTTCDDAKIYLWDAATGRRKAVLEGSTNTGLYAAFHPSGTLLASNGWEGQFRLWDPILGRTVLSLTTNGPSGSEFSRDGQIVVMRDDAVSTYEVEPALEYRTFAHAFVEPSIYWRASIRHDGRVLALGTDRGVALWDLARGTELPFLPIGHTWYALFEASGDLLIVSSSRPGVYRWPIRLDSERGEFRIGPPRRLRLPPGSGVVAEDRAGRTVAVPCRTFAAVSTPERTVLVKPLDDVRSVAVSPDGKWLATGSHHRGAQVWRIRDAIKVAELPVDSGTSVTFSPDGKWLMTKLHPRAGSGPSATGTRRFGSVATGSASRPTAAI